MCSRLTIPELFSMPLFFREKKREGGKRCDEVLGVGTDSYTSVSWGNYAKWQSTFNREPQDTGCAEVRSLGLDEFIDVV